MFTTGDRLALQELLEGVLQDKGLEKHVYFQPPPQLVMKYPCLIYHLSEHDTTYADNRPYRRIKGYELIVVDEDPDSIIPDLIANLPLSSFVRRFTTENLNHTVFTLFF